MEGLERLDTEKPRAERVEGVSAHPRELLGTYGIFMESMNLNPMLHCGPFTKIKNCPFPYNHTDVSSV